MTVVVAPAAVGEADVADKAKRAATHKMELAHKVAALARVVVDAVAEATVPIYRAPWVLALTGRVPAVVPGPVLHLAPDLARLPGLRPAERAAVAAGRPGGKTGLRSTHRPICSTRTAAAGWIWRCCRR